MVPPAYRYSFNPTASALGEVMRDGRVRGMNGLRALTLPTPTPPAISVPPPTRDHLREHHCRDRRTRAGGDGGADGLAGSTGLPPGPWQWHETRAARWWSYARMPIASPSPPITAVLSLDDDAAPAGRRRWMP
jgi:hypothetical protein